MDSASNTDSQAKAVNPESIYPTPPIAIHDVFEAIPVGTGGPSVSDQQLYKESLHHTESKEMPSLFPRSPREQPSKEQPSKEQPSREQTSRESPPRKSPSRESTLIEFSPPSKEDYDLMIHFVESMAIKRLEGAHHSSSYLMNLALRRDNRVRLLAENEAIAAKLRPQPQSPKKATSRTVQKAVISGRVSKPIAKRASNSSTAAEKRTRNSVPKVKLTCKWDEIPNYAPSDSLINKQILNVKVNGNPNPHPDDPTDPLRSKLCALEYELARILRLRGDQYLATKRRLFVHRVNYIIRHGEKNFGRTHAQQIGGIDVNKLSAMWEAFESIDWFNSEHFKGHVQAVKNAEKVYDPKNVKWVDRKEFFGF